MIPLVLTLIAALSGASIAMDLVIVHGRVLVTNDANHCFRKSPKEEFTMRAHRYAVGQPVSYAEDYAPNDVWRGATRLSIWSLPVTGSPSIRSGAPIRAMTVLSGNPSCRKIPAWGRCG